ncbi:hypothetical protein ACFVP0_04795 [Streptomyces cinereoruber]
MPPPHRPESGRAGVCTVGPAGGISEGGSNPAKLATTTTEYNW